MEICWLCLACNERHPWRSLLFAARKLLHLIRIKDGIGVERKEPAQDPGKNRNRDDDARVSGAAWRDDAFRRRSIRRFD
jgi:hypothetical protein